MMRRLRRGERPLVDEPRVLGYDLLEVGEMADPAWSLGSILAHNPGWTGQSWTVPGDDEAAIKRALTEYGPDDEADRLFDRWADEVQP